MVLNGAVVAPELALVIDDTDERQLGRFDGGSDT